MHSMRKCQSAAVRVSRSRAQNRPNLKTASAVCHHMRQKHSHRVDPRVAPAVGSRSSSPTRTVSTAVESQSDVSPMQQTMEDSRVFAEKSLGELLTAYAVFTTCRFQSVVQNSDKLMKLGRRVLGNYLFERVMRATFYGHFVGGEDARALQPRIEKLRRCGVGAILDYAVENDISRDEAVEAEMSGCVSEVEQNNAARFQRDSRFVAHPEFGDRRDDVVSARTYFYEDEHKCEENVEIFLRCIHTAAKCSDTGFAAIKLTSLGRPQFLLQLSAVLEQTRKFFDALSGPFPGDVMRRSVDQQHFIDGLSRLRVQVATHDACQWFTFLDNDRDGRIDLLEWNQLLDRRNNFSRLFVAPDASGELKPLVDPLTEEEETQMKNMLNRLDILAKTAENCGVKLMVDAEQTYFQPAINRLVMELMRRYNKQAPVIFNTYQCYLRESFNNMTIDLKLALKEDFHFGAKIVRGAYMNQERKRAADVGYPDPVNPSYASTTRMYERVVGECLTQISAGNKVAIMVATHNQESIHFTTERMHQLGIEPRSQAVYFGQLLGMKDSLSFDLGRRGYLAYKYVPFGPVKEVLPYLTRRAHENSAMVSSTGQEIKEITTEIRRRVFPLAAA